MIEVSLFATALLIAFANGTNSVMKGFSTYYGATIGMDKIIISIAVLTTFIGCIVSLIISTELIRSFSGFRIVPTDVVGSGIFMLSVGVGSSVVVLVSTYLRMPVATTHALVGSIVGSGLMANLGVLNWSAVIKTFMVPLIISPIVGFIGSLFVVMFYIKHNKLENIFERRYHSMISIVHLCTAALINFGRGLNDAPKIAAIVLGTQHFSGSLGLWSVSFAMAVGGLFGSHRVGGTIGRKLAKIGHGTGIITNSVSALVVVGASFFGVPVSTTHVVVGSTAGTGHAGRSLNPAVWKAIVLSWVFTLPGAACASALVYLVLR